MQHAKKVIYWLMFLMLVSGCSTAIRRSFYPEEILGDQIAFYTSSTELTANKYLVHRDVLYTFHRDGSYTGTLDGDLYELGTYSYHLTKNSNKATLIIHYVDHHTASQTYTIHMQYESAYAGNWEISYSSSPNVQLREFGTFRFLR